jgi:hypothetical protein
MSVEAKPEPSRRRVGAPRDDPPSRSRWGGVGSRPVQSLRKAGLDHPARLSTLRSAMPYRPRGGKRDGGGSRSSSPVCSLTHLTHVSALGTEDNNPGSRPGA